MEKSGGTILMAGDRYCPIHGQIPCKCQGDVIYIEQDQFIQKDTTIVPKINFINNQFFVQGWQCPKCKTVWSPSVQNCITCYWKCNVCHDPECKTPNEQH